MADGSVTTSTGGQASIIVKDEGTEVGSATTINFTGNGTISASGNEITVDIPAGGSGPGVTTANVVTDSLAVSGLSTLTGNVEMNGSLTLDCRCYW